MLHVNNVYMSAIVQLTGGYMSRARESILIPEGFFRTSVSAALMAGVTSLSCQNVSFDIKSDYVVFSYTTLRSNRCLLMFDGCLLISLRLPLATCFL